MAMHAANLLHVSWNDYKRKGQKIESRESWAENTVFPDGEATSNAFKLGEQALDHQGLSSDSFFSTVGVNMV